jgi:hypothetical protein
MDNDNAGRQSDVVDVQLLDVLAQVDAVLRHGRELQREALRIRGVPDRLTADQRRSAGTAVRDRVDEMHADCTALCQIVDELRVSAHHLERLLGT